MHRLLVCLVLVGSPAFAQEAPSAPKTEGEYGGVQPGQPKKPDGKKKMLRKGTLSWIGFEARNGTSEVFLQSVAPFEVSQRVEKGTLVVTLSGLSRLGQNTWRPIDTRFFETPVSSVVARKRGRNVEVRITFKNASDAAQASVRTATEADGLFYAYLTFAGGTPAEK